MEVLDQPISQDQEEVPEVKRRWTWFEKIVPAGFLLLVLWREAFSSLWAYDAIEYSMYAFAGAYAAAFYWIGKPGVRTPRTVIVTILYGIMFSLEIIFFTGWILLWVGQVNKEVVFSCLSCCILVLVVDVLLAWGKKLVADSRMLVRLIILGIILIVMFTIPESKHVIFTYRKYPDFVAYYKEHQSEGRFIYIWKGYFKDHPYPPQTNDPRPTE